MLRLLWPNQAGRLASHTPAALKRSCDAAWANALRDLQSPLKLVDSGQQPLRTQKSRSLEMATSTTSEQDDVFMRWNRAEQQNEGIQGWESSFVGPHASLARVRVSTGTCQMCADGV